ncbi:hypothetical protein BJ546DRAFT_490235 [Cryomyces antarcticus]
MKTPNGMTCVSVQACGLQVWSASEFSSSSSRISSRTSSSRDKLSDQCALPDHNPGRTPKPSSRVDSASSQGQARLRGPGKDSSPDLQRMAAFPLSSRPKISLVPGTWRLKWDSLNSSLLFPRTFPGPFFHIFCVNGKQHVVPNLRRCFDAHSRAVQPLGNPWACSIQCGCARPSTAH